MCFLRRLLLSEERLTLPSVMLQGAHPESLPALDWLLPKVVGSLTVLDKNSVTTQEWDHSIFEEQPNPTSHEQIDKIQSFIVHNEALCHKVQWKIFITQWTYFTKRPRKVDICGKTTVSVSLQTSPTVFLLVHSGFNFVHYLFAWISRCYLSCQAKSLPVCVGGGGGVEFIYFRAPLIADWCLCLTTEDT